MNMNLWRTKIGLLAGAITVTLLVSGCSSPSVAQSGGESTTPMRKEATPVEETGMSRAVSNSQDAGASVGSPSPQQEEDNPYRQYQLRDLQRVKIKLAGKVFDSWVMDTEGKRSEGMMFLRDAEVKDDDSMIFVFREPQELGFWMRNTYISLDIAYMDAKGKIITIAQMNALDETSHPSKGKAKFALEMKKGAFKRNGIKVGMVADIPLDVVAKD